MSAQAAVVLVHGLWMTGAELSWLQRRLARCGLRPVQFRYATVRRSVEDNAERLRRLVSTLSAPEIHYVGHSLGGLVVLQMLATCPDPRPGRAVLLGTACQPCHVARRMSALWLGRRLLGGSAEALCREAPHAPADREVGVIAGSRSLGLGLRLFPAPPGANDGTVRVEETYLPGMKAHRVLPVSHTGMVFSARVAEQVCAFLKTGAFVQAA